LNLYIFENPIIILYNHSYSIMSDTDQFVNELAKEAHKKRSAERREKEINDMKDEDIKRSIVIKNILKEYNVDENQIDEVTIKIITQLRQINFNSLYNY